MSRPIAGRGDCSRRGKALAAPLLALATLVLTGLTAVWAQDQAPARPRVRTLLQSARECYGRGDYETASFFYDQVKANEKDLTPAEVNDLNNQVLLNNEALRKRHEGADQVHKAADALQQGKIAEANNLLKSAGLNQYLGANDRRLMAQLSQQLRTGTPIPQTGPPGIGMVKTPLPPNRDDAAARARALLQEGRVLLSKGDYLGATAKANEAERLNAVYMPGEDTHIQLYLDIDRSRRTGKVPAAPAKIAADPKALLSAARAAYQRSDLDAAEDLANQAEKASSNVVMPWLHAPWADTPAKVLRDVKAARARQAPVPVPSGSSFKGVKSLFSRGNSNGAETGKPDDRTMPPVEGPTLGDGPSLNGPPRVGPTSMTAPPAPAYAAAQTADVRTRPADPVKDDRAVAMARQLVREGYQAFAKNDLERARKCALEAKNLHAGLNWWEDNPDKLLADIQRKAPPVVATAGKDAKAPASARLDGHALVREGRSLLRDGKLEEADKVCGRAATTQTSWGLFEDSPDKLRHDIQNARSRHDRDESVRLLADARKVFAQGQLQEAKTKAWRAQQLHGPYSIWDLGDRPQKLLAEIERSEADLRAAGKLPPASVVDQHSTAPLEAVSSRQGAGPAPAPVADMVAKQRAVALLADARVLQSRGQLIEARQKALEAQRAAGEATRPGFLFGPDEDRPETALLQLSSLCDTKINNLLQHAGDCVTASASDPTRFQRAQADLAQARRLAQGFGLDPSRIDHKVTWVQETAAADTLAQGPRPLSPDLVPSAGPGLAQVASQDPPSKGKDLLDRARLELKSGQTAMARRLAAAAYKAGPEVQPEAESLLRSIDAEEYNEARLAANRSADAGFEAFQHGEYRQAASIFRAINEDFLDPEKRTRLKEISGLPAMQPTKVASTPGAASGPVQLSGADFKAPSAEGPGLAHVSDGAGQSREAGNDTFERLRALEEIQLQQLREEALRAQRDAIDRARAGDLVAAIDILRDFSVRLKDGHGDPEKVAALRRQVDSRLHQFSTLKAQRDFEKEQTTGFVSAAGSEHARELEKHKRDTEVADLLKQFRTLYHEGKLTEADMIAQKAHTLDPDNVAADAAVNMMEIAINDRRAKEISKAKRDQFMTQLDDHPGPALDPQKKPLAFSDDKAYQDRVRARNSYENGIQFPSHNPIEKSIERKLMTPISPINFKDVPLRQAIEDLGTLSPGVNIYIDKKAIDEAGINLELPLSLKLENNVSLKSALNLLLYQLNLTYIVKDEVLQITTDDKAHGRLRRALYPVADLVIPPSDGTLPNTSNFNMALERATNTSGGLVNGGATPFLPQNGLAGGTPVGSPGSSMASGSYHGLQPSPQASVVRSGQTIEEVLINLIKCQISPDSWSDVGGKGTINYYPVGLSLVVNQTQDIQEQVADLLAALRKLQELEVAIEMKMITVSEAFYEMIGVNFDINIQNNSARFGPQLVTQNFQTAGQINNFSPNGFVSGLTPTGAFTPDLSIPITNSSFQFSQPPFGGFPGTLGMDGGLSMGLAFLSEIQVFMFMEAAQVDRRTNVMQAPKITVFNGQTANITVQDQQFFLTGVQLVQAGAQVFFVPNQQPFPLGVQLQVTPVVSADRRFVRVNLQPTLTNLASTNVPLIPVQIPVPQLFEGPGAATTSGGQPVIFQMFFQQPTLTQIQLNTTVSVPDGGTVLLGGLKTLSEGRTEAGPPILSKIPYINRLFRNTAYGRDSQSLLIMVTPRIIINEEEERIFLGDIPPIPRDQP